MATMFEKLVAYGQKSRKSKDPATRRTNLPDGVLSPDQAAQRGLPAYSKLSPGATDSQLNPITGSGVLKPGQKRDTSGNIVPGFDPAQEEVLRQRQLQQELDDREKRRPKGRASTIITGGMGLIDAPTTARRSLMGF